MARVIMRFYRGDKYVGWGFRNGFLSKALGELLESGGHVVIKGVKYTKIVDGVLK